MLHTYPLPTVESALVELRTALETASAQEFVIYMSNQRKYREDADRFGSCEIRHVYNAKNAGLSAEGLVCELMANQVTVSFTDASHSGVATPSVHAHLICSDNIANVVSIASLSPLYMPGNADTCGCAALFSKEAFICFGTQHATSECDEKAAASLTIQIGSILCGRIRETVMETRNWDELAMLLLCCVQSLIMHHTPERLMHVCSTCNDRVRAYGMAEVWAVSERIGGVETQYRSGVCGTCRRDMLLKKMHKLRTLPSLAEAAARSGVALNDTPPSSPDGTKQIAKRRRADDDTCNADSVAETVITAQ